MFVKKRKAKRTEPFQLDTPLLQITPRDDFTIGNSMEGIAIFGATGSGKTSGSGATLARAMLTAGYGGLVLCAKPEECKLWMRYAEETGRSQDIMRVAPDERHRFNFLSYELLRKGRGGGQTENLVQLFSTLQETVQGKAQQDKGEAFWKLTMEELVRNAIEILALGQGDFTLNDLRTFIAEAPQSPEDTIDVSPEGWMALSFCAHAIARAAEPQKTAIEEQNFHMAKQYWLEHYAGLADRTRSSIVAMFTSLADMLLHGVAWELLCTSTNLFPEYMYEDGAIIVLDLPILEYHQVGRMVQNIIKYSFQRALLTRDADQFPRPCFLWADEAQNFISPFDYQFLSVARSARVSTVYMTQNISNYYAVLGQGGKDEVNALLGNFQTKIFHANADLATNTYAADIIAKGWTNVANASTQAGFEAITQTGGTSEAVEYKVFPAEFTTLRKGGTSNHGQVEAILFQGGRIWQASGDTYLKTAFLQH